MSREVMQMALETAEQIAYADYRHWEELASLSEFERWARSRANHIADALRTALAQADVPETAFGETEPVAWMYDWTTSDGEFIQDWTTSEAETLRDTEPNIISNIRPLYTVPPAKEWVGLTDWEIDDVQYDVDCRLHRSYARAIEAKLKEKNT